ncbi:hypothetical protein TSAR_013497 [Trichomalopsis sarcophagae]|uniref:Uncharacterized protein n=1 Tax=Trichomalopsis sarcophagae TaxID=543379 RepID=A0A232EFY3_9HYME|nr:hypothetical protein TSAR_013497 [Trichomalopsis sarcophagae]
MKQLQFHLQQVAQVAILYLETVMSRGVVNLEEMYATTVQELKKELSGQIYPYLLRKWLHSLEDITQNSAQKFSDALYCKLHSRVRTASSIDS